MPYVDYELVIGDKRWSSWSLRPWLLLKTFGIPFKEVLVPLRHPETASAIARHGPSGKVPVLKAGGVVIWDSLAITEFVAEENGELAIWPADKTHRAVARAVSAEMHCGFHSLRKHLPMDVLNVYSSWPPEDSVEEDIRRIVAIWTDCRRSFSEDGDYLFGAFSAVDAMFAPVATRFRSYSVDLGKFGDDGTAGRYAETILAHPAMAEWREGAARES